MDTLDVVDERDQVIGQASYRACEQQGLLHRCAAVLVFKDTSFREVLIFRRAAGIGDAGKFGAPSGHVMAGQTYEQAALQELQEEVFHGITFPKLQLHFLGKIRNKEYLHKEWIGCFWTVWGGPFQGDPYEVGGDLGFVNRTELLKRIVKNNNGFAETLRLQLQLAEQLRSV